MLTSSNPGTYRHCQGGTDQLDGRALCAGGLGGFPGRACSRWRIWKGWGACIGPGGSQRVLATPAMPDVIGLLQRCLPCPCPDLSRGQL